jgi:hypothetical protein
MEEAGISPRPFRRMINPFNYPAHIPADAVPLRAGRTALPPALPRPMPKRKKLGVGEVNRLRLKPLRKAKDGQFEKFCWGRFLGIILRTTKCPGGAQAAIAEPSPMHAPGHRAQLQFDSEGPPRRMSFYGAIPLVARMGKVFGAS